MNNVRDKNIVDSTTEKDDVKRKNTIVNTNFDTTTAIVSTEEIVNSTIDDINIHNTNTKKPITFENLQNGLKHLVSRIQSLNYGYEKEHQTREFLINIKKIYDFKYINDMEYKQIITEFNELLK